MTDKSTKNPGIFKSFISGFGMGVANVIPGVSGGTVAFITGIFEPLVNAVSDIASSENIKLFFTLHWQELCRRLPLKFLLCLFAGILVALVSASKIILWALGNHPAETFAIFLGMMAASVIIMWKDVKKWSLTAIPAFVAGCVIAFATVNLVPVDTPETWWMAFAAGAISVMAMILPGLSGSFLLLIMGQYTVLWGAVANLPGSLFTTELATLAAFAGGAIAGLAVFVKVLKWLFARHHDVTVALLIGFMAGSLPRLWPWNRDIHFSVKTAEGITCMSMPENAAQLAEAKTAGADITVLEFEYGLPESLTDASFLVPATLIIAGIILVILMEVAAKKGSAHDITAATEEK